MSTPFLLQRKLAEEASYVLEKEFFDKCGGSSDDNKNNKVSISPKLSLLAQTDIDILLVYNSE